VVVEEGGIEVTVVTGAVVTVATDEVVAAGGRAGAIAHPAMARAPIRR
jgi:hypothetical protein